jgi:hypothetical protein
VNHFSASEQYRPITGINKYEENTGKVTILRIWGVVPQRHYTNFHRNLSQGSSWKALTDGRTLPSLRALNSIIRNRNKHNTFRLKRFQRVYVTDNNVVGAGVRTFLRHVSELLQGYNASHSTRQRSSWSVIREPQLQHGKYIFYCHNLRTKETTLQKDYYYRLYIIFLGLWPLFGFIFLYTVGRPSLWSSGQSSWLQNGDALCFL